jgi:hypothetical protein
LAGTPRDDLSDWVVPAVLAGLALVVAVVVAVVVAFASGSEEDETVAQELETWSRCLRSQGAPVPLVEALRDGGFRITVDADVLDRDVDLAAMGAAFEACRQEAPERIRDLVDRMDMFGAFPFAGGFPGMGDVPFDAGAEHFGGDGGFFDRGEPIVPNVDEDTLEELCDRALDRLERDLPVRPRLRQACDLDA